MYTSGNKLSLRRMLPRINVDTHSNAYSDSISIAMSVPDKFSRTIPSSVPRSMLIRPCTARITGIRVRVKARTKLTPRTSTISSPYFLYRNVYGTLFLSLSFFLSNNLKPHLQNITILHDTNQPD